MSKTEIKQYQKYIYFLLFINGACSLVLEILGGRVLAPYYSNTVFVWSGLISTALGFLALGYYLGGNSLITNKYLLQAPFLTTGLAGIIIFIEFSFRHVIFNFSDKFSFQLAPVIASVLLFGIPFLVFGLLTPIAINLSNDFKFKTKTISGKYFSVGTIGSLFGALLAVYWLIPNFALSQIIHGLSMLLVLVSVMGIGYKKASFLIILLFLILSLTLDLGDKYNDSITRDATVLFETRDFYADYALISYPTLSGDVFCLLIDSNMQGCVDSAARIDSYHSYVANVMNILPEKSDVLILGAGIGTYIKYWDDLGLNYDIVDINPDAKKYANMAGVSLDEKRIKLVTSDARTYVRKSARRYDLIYNDLFGNVSPITSVYTNEFNKLVKSKLVDGGVFLTHAVGKSDGTDIFVNSVISTLKETFKNVGVLSADPKSQYSYVLIVASEDEDLLKNINKDITSKSIDKKEQLVYTEATNYSGDFVSDEKNPLDYYWAKNLSKYYSIDEFRSLFKKYI